MEELCWSMSITRPLQALIIGLQGDCAKTELTLQVLLLWFGFYGELCVGAVCDICIAL